MEHEALPSAVYHGHARARHRWAAAVISVDKAGNRTVHWESPPTYGTMQEALRAAEVEFKTLKLVPLKK